MAAALPVSNGQWHLDEIFVMIDGRVIPPKISGQK
jgi:hypothetical protein